MHCCGGKHQICYRCNHLTGRCWFVIDASLLAAPSLTVYINVHDAEDTPGSNIGACPHFHLFFIVGVGLPLQFNSSHSWTFSIMALMAEFIVVVCYFVVDSLTDLIWLAFFVAVAINGLPECFNWLLRSSLAPWTSTVPFSTPEHTVTLVVALLQTRRVTYFFFLHSCKSPVAT
jgi:hypothetical protein